MASTGFSTRRLTYAPVGATSAAALEWTHPSGFRTFERTLQIRKNNNDWLELSAAAANWEVKTRSGFVVTTDEADSVCATAGTSYRITIRLLGGIVRITEPVRVVEVVDLPDRKGFAYGTLEGHPVSGEEAFVVHCDADGIWLTLRSVTRPAPRGLWRLSFPALMVAQRVYRRRYFNAFGRVAATTRFRAFIRG